MEPTSSPSTIPSPRRGWFSRNWRTLTTALLLVLFVAIAYPAVMFYRQRHSEPYQTAIRDVRKSPEVIERLGEPVEEIGITRWIPSGSMYVENDRGQAHWDFDVAGPKGTAHVRSQSRRIDGKWQQVVLEVTFANGQKLRLDEDQANEAPKFGAPSGEAPKFAPPKVETPKKVGPGDPGTDLKIDIPT